MTRGLYHTVTLTNISVSEVKFIQIHANKIEPMTFRTLVGRSTTEPQERIWRARSLHWVMTHAIYCTVTGITLVCHERNDRF